MPVPTAICHFNEQRLQLKILKIAPVSGGSINQVYTLLTSQDKFLVKINNKNAFPGMFRLESEGLNTIKQTNTVAVPDVILRDNIGDDSFLLSAWTTLRSNHLQICVYSANR